MKTISQKLSKVLFLLILPLIGCGSKFSEGSPNSVNVRGYSLKDRTKQKTRIDSRIDEIQNSTKKLKKIIDLLKQTQSPRSGEDVYTPIDFLIDANAELKTKMPEKNENKLVRHGIVILPIGELSERCRRVEVLLESSIIYADEDTKKQATGDRLTYSIKTCGSDEKFLSVITADWIGSNLDFSVNNKNLSTALNDIVVTDELTNSTCKVQKSDKKILESIHCENFKVKLSTSEYALVNYMNFNNTGDVRFESQADIYENDKMKADVLLKVYSNGTVDFDVNKTEDHSK